MRQSAHTLIFLTRAIALTMLLSGCSGGMVQRGEPQTGAASVAQGSFSVWQDWHSSELPQNPDPANTQLTQAIFVQLPNTCTAKPWPGLAQAQQALFDHLAAYLQAGLSVSLNELSIGPVQDVPGGCDYLVLYSGRMGGLRPGWLLLGLVRPADGQLLAFAALPVAGGSSLTDLDGAARRLTGSLIR